MTAFPGRALMRARGIKARAWGETPVRWASSFFHRRQPRGRRWRRAAGNTTRRTMKMFRRNCAWCARSLRRADRGDAAIPRLAATHPSAPDRGCREGPAAFLAGTPPPTSSKQLQGPSERESAKNPGLDRVQLRHGAGARPPRGLALGSSSTASPTEGGWPGLPEPCAPAAAE